MVLQEVQEKGGQLTPSAQTAHPTGGPGHPEYSYQLTFTELFRVAPSRLRHPPRSSRTMPTLTHAQRRRPVAVAFEHSLATSRMPEQPATSTQSALDIGTATDVGRVREANEDSFLAVRPAGERNGEALVAVADGMGGHKAGEVASALAVQALQQMLDDSDPAVEADALLTRALELGNRSIWDAAAEDVDKEGMGTTFVAALLNAAGQAVVANVGD